MDIGMDQDIDSDDSCERDLLGRANKAIMEKENEKLHRAVARTITSVSFSELACKFPDDQTLLMCAEKAENEMARSLAAIENRVPGFLPMQRMKKTDFKPVRLPNSSSVIF